MILSSRFSFAFVHIPKCAGTTVLRALAHLDDCKARQTSGLARHPRWPDVFDMPDIGWVHFSHPTLRFLKQHFPEDFASLAASRSFSIVREPHQRILSSCAETLKQFEGIDVAGLSDSQFLEHLERLLTEIAPDLKSEGTLRFDRIVFQPQADYLYLDGEKVVDEVLPIDRMDDFERTVLDYLALQGMHIPRFEERAVNRSRLYRNPVIGSLVQAAKPVQHLAREFLPTKLRKRIGDMLFVARDERFGHFAQSEMVRSFVRDHYAQDVEIWARASRDNAE